MCKFCEPMLESPRPFNERIAEDLVIMGNKLMTDNGTHVKINYCPICGRDLEQEQILRK